METCRQWAVWCAAILFLTGVIGVAARAHDVTHRGTVVAVEPSRVHVQMLTESGERGERQWFTVGDSTKVLRGDMAVAFAEADISPDERIVVIVNHDVDPLAAVEIRLAAR